MDLNSVLEKLEPLIPKRVTRWKRTLAAADSAVTATLERHIRWVARKKLGDDLDRQVLLSLPPEILIAEKVELGNVVYQAQLWRFGLSLNELTQHVAILGRSGAGKTNVSFQLLKALVSHGIPWVFLDWKRSARDLMLSMQSSISVCTPGRHLGAFAFNPFLVPPGMECNSFVNLIVDQFADAYTLGEGAKSLLQDALLSCYQQATPSVSDVLSKIESLPAVNRAVGWKMSALRALRSYSLSIPQEGTAEQQQAFARQLLSGHTILELDGLSHSAKKFLVPLICQWLYSVQLGTNHQREKLKLVVFLEEAHHVLYRGEHRSKETLMNRMLRQCRELGIGFVVLDQQPNSLSAAALGNCFTSICLNQKHPQDVTTAAELSAVKATEKQLFSSLPVGQGVVKLQDRWPRPFLVQFDLMPVHKGAMTDELLQLYLSRDATGNRSIVTPEIPHASGQCESISGMSPTPSGQTGQRQIPSSLLQAEVFRAADRVPPTDQVLALLHDCVQFPNDGVRRRYRRLRIGTTTGTRLKNALIDAGLLLADTRKVGRSVRTRLRLTSLGKQLLLPPEAGRDARASFDHEYWKRQTAERFAASGFKTAYEVARKAGEGRVDLVASRGADSIAIEVETGKSDVVANVLNNLRAGYREVLVVAVDKEAKRRVESQLVRSGLLMPPRVRVELREERTLS